MTTALITHPDCTLHVTPDWHAEAPARMRAVLSALNGCALVRLEAPDATDAQLLRVHPQRYLDRLRDTLPDDDSIQELDPDTFLSHGSLRAARRSAGGAILAVDQVLSGQVQNAFVVTRPPGHHAETETPMGFCLFGNVAAAAKHALDHHGLSRVAIVDFDVHHGNGTQALVQDDPRILFVSSHEMPLYPGTGDPSDCGPHGSVLNVALTEGTTGPQMLATYEAQVFPRLTEFAPELLIISAGFDAHADDPKAGLALLEQDYAPLTERLCDIADASCAGRVVSCLEGGYNLDALGRSARVHTDVLIRRGA